MNKDIPRCKRFTGYKPCYPDYNCWEYGCKDLIPIGAKILIINLDAMGDVLMTTAQLPGLKRKFPESTIFWITLKNAAPLLFNNPLIDQIFEYNAESISVLKEMSFDYVMNVDKSVRSGALLNSLKAGSKLGFGINEDGKIIPVNQGAYYNYRLGMDDNLKFKVNKKTGQEYLAETFELDYQKDEYVFFFTDEETEFIRNYKEAAGITGQDNVVGFNTGCSELYPNKKMTVQQHIELIEILLKKNKYKIALFGGPEDTERNLKIAAYFGNQIINTPTTEGLRRGICYESIADLIVTGDSLGMHIGIALKKYIIAWFGVSCWSEIELYNRGVKIYHPDLFCSPCWKRVCPYNLECISMLRPVDFIEEIDKYFNSQNSN